MSVKKIHLYNTEDIKNPFPKEKKFVVSWIQESIIKRGFKIKSLAIIFCSDEYLLEMNIKHLNHDYYTDVITFDNSEPSSNIIDGEIYISLDRVKDNSATFDEPLKKEVLRIIAHGVLHLLGHTDKTEEERKAMTEEENNLLLEVTHLY